MKRLCTAHNRLLRKPMLLVLTVMLLLLLAHTSYTTPTRAAAPDDTRDTLDQTIYLELKGAACIRRLHAQGTIGCATEGNSGLKGTIRLVQSQQAARNIVNNPPDTPVVLLLALPFFNDSMVQKYESAMDLRGILLLPQAPPPAKGYSPALKEPQQTMRLPWHAPFQWNPNGDGLNRRSFNYAVFRLVRQQVQDVLARATFNEEQVARGAFPPYEANMNTHMYAKTNSKACLAKGTCVPMGGYSVWASLGPIGQHNANATAPPIMPNVTRIQGVNTSIVLATTHMDATAFFPSQSYGADAALSGLVALLEAATVLAHVPDVARLPKQIVFAVFDGETWSYAGSRKFVADTANFTCAKEGPAPASSAPPGSAGACDQPWAPDLTFTRFNLSDIDAILELNQVGLGQSNLFMHREAASSGVSAASAAKTDRLRAQLEAAAASVRLDGSTLQVRNASTGTPGVPPSSYASFLRHDRNIPGIVMTDHADVYANQYFHSQFDSFDGNFDIESSKLCDVATLVARTLYAAAGGVDVGVRPAADCRRVRSLYHCMAEDWSNCEFAAQYGGLVPNQGAGALRTDSGVYFLLPEADVLGLPRFVGLYLAEVSANASRASHFGPLPSSPDHFQSFAYYHAAVDPNFVFDFGKNRYIMTNDSGVVSPMWTESFESPTSIRGTIYRVEDPFVAWVMFFCGLGIIVLSVVAMGCSKRWCRRHLKDL